MLASSEDLPGLTRAVELFRKMRLEAIGLCVREDFAAGWCATCCQNAYVQWFGCSECGDGSEHHLIETIRAESRFWLETAFRPLRLGPLKQFIELEDIQRVAADVASLFEAGEELREAFVRVVKLYAEERGIALIDEASVV